MPFQCPNCGEEKVTYDDANMSSCDNCSESVPNAHLRGLREN